MEIISLDQFLTFHATKVENSKCVLLLGPRFGLTTDKQGTTRSISESVRMGLEEYYGKKPGFNWQERIDCQFDNLFIMRNVQAGKTLELFELRAQLSQQYLTVEQQSTHPIYTQIAQLPFNAIINCTPDTLLQKAFEDGGIDHDFFYYSPKGQQQKRPDPPRANVPILLNMFGYAKDQDSFLITYEHFFNFVFSMLGNSETLPDTLKKLVREADLFVLLGFDLEKWYIPLLLRRLNQEKQNAEQQKTNVFSGGGNFTSDDAAKLASSMFVFDDTTTPDHFVGTLIEKIKPRAIDLTTSLKSAPVQKLLREDKLMEGILLLRKMLQEAGKDTIAVDNQSANLMGAEMDHRNGVTTGEVFGAKKNQIRIALFEFAKLLDE
jgi:SIR2-like domain